MASGGESLYIPSTDSLQPHLTNDGPNKDNPRQPDLSFRVPAPSRHLPPVRTTITADVHSPSGPRHPGAPPQPNPVPSGSSSANRQDAPDGDLGKNSESVQNARDDGPRGDPPQATGGAGGKAQQHATNPQPSLTVQQPAKNEKLLPEAEEASHAPSHYIVICKWLVIALTALLFLACIVCSKLSIVHMTSTLRLSNTPGRNVGESSSSVFLMLLIIIMIPYATTLIRSIWCGGLRSDRPWPSKKALAWGIVTAVSESAGITLFTLEVLPLSPSYIGVLLMNGIFVIPIIMQIIFSIRRHRRGIRSEKRWATVLLIVACIFSVAGLGLTAMFEILNNDYPNEKLWEVPLSILLLSFAWCPLIQKLQLNPTEKALRKLIGKSGGIKYNAMLNEQDAGLSTTSGTSATSGTRRDSNSTAWSKESEFTASVIRDREKDPDELLLCWAHPQFSSRWKISIITSFLKLLFIPGFALLFGQYLDIVNVKELYKGFNEIEVTSPSFVCLMLSIFASLGGYLFGWGACVMGIHKAAFTAPLLLGTPLAVTAILVKDICQLIFRHGPHDHMCVNSLRHEYSLTAACFLYLSQLLSVGIFLFKTVHIVLPKESQIFWLPGYNNVLFEQHLLLSRKNKQTDASYQDPRVRALKTRVFICTTMFREAAHEMEQLLKSYARVNIAKQESNRNFEAHIFLDNGVRDTRLTPFALQLVSLIKKTLDLPVEVCTKLNTPYGMKLTWEMARTSQDTNGMALNVHLKDNRKVKNKKRWSQIMYMSYIMDYCVPEDDRATDQESYILTTDADIKFAPDSVEALLDLMTRDENVGAVCSRTYPMGSGPVYWYQIFDYAIGHWLQKVANHVLGSVLCCPGCFSVYRVKALRDVVSTYASSVTKAGEFLTKDMGEDRWLCTLMVQSGWRLEYCAAAENSTYCPEEFDEYFKQRRRWIPSSLANQILLLQEWRTIMHFNKQISVLFILYQAILLISALLNPSMLFVIIIGGMQYGVGVPQVFTFIVLLIITFGYTWICISCSQDTQLKFAKGLTIFFALVMAAVWIGVAVQVATQVAGPTSEDHTTVAPTAPPKPPTIKPNLTKMVERFNPKLDSHIFHLNREPEMITLPGLDLTSPTSPVTTVHAHQDNWPIKMWGEGLVRAGFTSHPPTAEPTGEFTLPVTPVYLGLMTVVYILTSVLHISEFYCLFHGIWYLLCLPAGSLVLVIYSVCNITDRSWGTREEKTKETFANEADWRTTLVKFCKSVCVCCPKGSVCGTRSSNDVEPDSESGDESNTNPAKDSAKPRYVSRRLRPPREESGTAVSSDPATDEEYSGLEGTYRKSTKLERNLSFRFHTDGADTRPVSVMDWLSSDLRKQHGPKFINNGYEDTSFIAGMSEAEIRELGISSMAIINAIMDSIRQLPELDIQPSVPELVERWLDSIGLQMYRRHFRRAHIITRSHLEHLRSMKKQDFINELGITKPGHLRRLRIAIEHLRYPTAAEKERHEVKTVFEKKDPGNLSEFSPREHEFWERIRQACLLPESVAFAHDLDLKEKLTELRNTCLLGVGVANALFLIIILTLYTKQQLNFQGTNFVGMCFAALFGLVLIIQFLTMVVHRVSTCMHMIARAPLWWGDPYNATWTWNQSKMAPLRLSDGTDTESERNVGDSTDVIARISRDQTVEEARRRLREPPIDRSHQTPHGRSDTRGWAGHPGVSRVSHVDEGSWAGQTNPDTEPLVQPIRNDH